MELGLTLPMQRFLKQRPLPYGQTPDRRFCWELHVITLQGHKSLLAVHCHSRYTFVRYHVPCCAWAELPALFEQGLTESLTAAGRSPQQVRQYWARAGEPVLTHTHGRREVAFLNRAWEDVLRLEPCLDPGSQAQPLLDGFANARPSRCAGMPGLAPAAERLDSWLP